MTEAESRRNKRNENTHKHTQNIQRDTQNKTSTPRERRSKSPPHFCVFSSVVVVAAAAAAGWLLSLFLTADRSLNGREALRSLRSVSMVCLRCCASIFACSRARIRILWALKRLWTRMTSRRKRQLLRASFEAAAAAAAAAEDAEGRRERGEPPAAAAAAAEAAELAAAQLALEDLMSVSSCAVFSVRRRLLSRWPRRSSSPAALLEDSSEKPTARAGVDEAGGAAAAGAGVTGDASVGEGPATTSMEPSARNLFWMLSMRCMEARFLAARAASTSSGLNPDALEGAAGAPEDEEEADPGTASELPVLGSGLTVTGDCRPTGVRAGVEGVVRAIAGTLRAPPAF